VSVHAAESSLLVHGSFAVINELDRIEVVSVQLAVGVEGVGEHEAEDYTHEFAV
jgi:hypothetical protein